MEQFKRLFGARVKELRQRRGLNGSELARLMGWHRTSVYHLEAGRDVPTMQNLVRLALVLRVDEMDLLTFPGATARHDLNDLTLDAPIATVLDVKRAMEKALAPREQREARRVASRK